MSNEINHAVVRASYGAYVTKNRAALEPLIADDFHFTSPLDNRIDRATYFTRCWPNSARTEGFDVIHCIPDGDRVLVTYEGRTVGGGRFQNTEILTLRAGQIIDVEVYFGWSIPHPVKDEAFVDKEKALTPKPALVAHFEVIGKNPETLRNYYGSLFGWKFDTNGPVAKEISETGNYGFVDRMTTPDGVGIPGGIGGGTGYSHHTIFYVGVAEAEAALAMAESLGGTRLLGPATKPGGGVVVGHFTHPEGNLIGVAGPK